MSINQISNTQTSVNSPDNQNLTFNAEINKAGYGLKDNDLAVLYNVGKPEIYDPESVENSKTSVLALAAPAAFAFGGAIASFVLTKNLDETPVLKEKINNMFEHGLGDVKLAENSKKEKLDDIWNGWTPSLDDIVNTVPSAKDWAPLRNSANDKNSSITSFIGNKDEMLSENLTNPIMPNNKFTIKTTKMMNFPIILDQKTQTIGGNNLDSVSISEGLIPGFKGDSDFSKADKYDIIGWLLDAIYGGNSKLANEEVTQNQEIGGSGGSFGKEYEGEHPNETQTTTEVLQNSETGNSIAPPDEDDEEFEKRIENEN